MIRGRSIALVMVALAVLLIFAYASHHGVLNGEQGNTSPFLKPLSDSYLEHSSASVIWKQHQSLLADRTYPRVFLLLPMTHSSLGFCQSLAILQGYDPILLNWGHDLPSRWKWWDQEIKPDRMSKIRKVAEWFEREEERWREDDVIITADATDLWFQLPKSCMIERFLNQPYDIIISAEKYCWPSNQRFMCDDYEVKISGKDVINKDGETLDRKSLPRYANAGFYIGRHPQLRALFRRMNQLIPLTNLWDDQGVLHLETWAGGGERYNISMDYGSSMIYTLAFGGGEFGLRGLERLPDAQEYVKGVKGQLDGIKGLEKRQYYGDSIPWVDEDGLVFTPETDEGGPNRWAFGHNHHTDRTSAALHFNGDSKLQAIHRTWNKMYWATGGSRGTDLKVMQEMVRRGKVRVGETGEELHWDKIRGKFGLAGERE